MRAPQRHDELAKLVLVGLVDGKREEKPPEIAHLRRRTSNGQRSPLARHRRGRHSARSCVAASARAFMCRSECAGVLTTGSMPSSCKLHQLGERRQCQTLRS